MYAYLRMDDDHHDVHQQVSCQLFAVGFLLPQDLATWADINPPPLDVSESFVS